MLKLLKMLKQIASQLEQMFLNLDLHMAELWLFQAALCSTEVARSEQRCDHQRA